MANRQVTLESRSSGKYQLKHCDLSPANIAEKYASSSSHAKKNTTVQKREGSLEFLQTTSFQQHAFLWLTVLCEKKKKKIVSNAQNSRGLGFSEGDGSRRWGHLSAAATAMPCWSHLRVFVRTRVPLSWAGSRTRWIRLKVLIAKSLKRGLFLSQLHFLWSLKCEQLVGCGSFVWRVPEIKHEFVDQDRWINAKNPCSSHLLRWCKKGSFPWATSRRPYSLPHDVRYFDNWLFSAFWFEFSVSFFHYPRCDLGWHKLISHIQMHSWIGCYCMTKSLCFVLGFVVNSKTFLLSLRRQLFIWTVQIACDNISPPPAHLVSPLLPKSVCGVLLQETSFLLLSLWNITRCCFRLTLCALWLRLWLTLWLILFWCLLVGAETHILFTRAHCFKTEWYNRCKAISFCGILSSYSFFGVIFLYFFVGKLRSVKEVWSFVSQMCGGACSIWGGEMFSFLRWCLGKNYLGAFCNWQKEGPTKKEKRADDRIGRNPLNRDCRNVLNLASVIIQLNQICVTF